MSANLDYWKLHVKLILLSPSLKSSLDSAVKNKKRDLALGYGSPADEE